MLSLLLALRAQDLPLPAGAVLLCPAVDLSGEYIRASGTQHAGSAHRHAPYSEKARSKLASGHGTRSALPWMSGNSSPCSTALASARRA